MAAAKAHARRGWSDSLRVTRGLLVSVGAGAGVGNVPVALCSGSTSSYSSLDACKWLTRRSTWPGVVIHGNGAAVGRERLAGICRVSPLVSPKGAFGGRTVVSVTATVPVSPVVPNTIAAVPIFRRVMCEWHGVDGWGFGAYGMRGMGFSDGDGVRGGRVQ